MSLWGIPKVNKCGRPVGFGVTQEPLDSTIYTSSKLVLRDFGFVHNFVMILHEMNKDESLSLASYAFIIASQLYMYCLSNTCYVKCLSKI